MSAYVEAVVNPGFVVPPLTTTAGSIVNRRRVKIPCNYPTEYSHNNQKNAIKPYVATFDIFDAESFLKCSSLRLTGTLKMTSDPTTEGTIDGDTLYYPRFDQSTQALISRLTIRNSQGMVIEDMPMYGLYANMISAYTQSMNHKGTKVAEYSNVGGKGVNNPHSREISAATPFQNSLSMKLQKEPLDLVIPFHHSSFLNRVEYFPTFLMRVPLRIEVEFQDPQLAFYYDTTKCIGEYSYRLKKDGNNGFVTEKGFIEVHRDPILQVGKRYIFVDSTTGQRGTLCVGRNNAGDSTHQMFAFPSPIGFAATSAGQVVAWDADETFLLDSEEDEKDKYRKGFIYEYNDVAPLDYSLSNLEILCDFVKPSSEVTLQYLNMFKEPAGITYPFTRVFYHNYTDDYQAKRPLQISLPFGVRSLRGIMVVITDGRSSQSVSGSAQRYFKSLSTFMARGLEKAQLRIGGQTFPEYELKFDTGIYVNQIPELELMLNQSNNSLFTYNFPPEELTNKAYNYTWTGDFTIDKPIQNSIDWTTNEVKSGWSSPIIAASVNDEPSKFVLAFPTLRNEGDFACGIDTNAAGSVALSLNFKTSYPQNKVIHIFAIADAVITLQSQSNLVRY